MALRVACFGGLILGVTTCGGPTNPSDTADLLVVGTHSGRLAYVSVAAGRMTEVLPLTLGRVLAYASDTSRNLAYITSTRGIGRRELRAIELRSGTTAWNLSMGDAGTTVLYDGVLLGGDPLGFDPVGNMLLLGFSIRNDTLGLAMLDPGSASVLAFRGSWRVFVIRALPHSGVLAVSVRGTGPPGPNLSHGVLLLDPSRLELLDSLALPPPLDHAGVFASSADGDRLYMGNGSKLFVYSRSGREVLKVVPRPAHGNLVVSPDGGTLVMSDPGIWPDYPGSGRLFLYDPMLNPLGEVELPPDPNFGLPSVTGSLAFSRDGRWLYVAAGTASIGPTFGSQQSRVFVVDARTMRFHRSIPLHDYGAPLLFPLR